jgi:hypothetical protein
MENKGLRIYEGLPPWARGLTVVGSLAVVVGVGYMVYQGIDRRKKNKEALAKANETLIATGSSLNAYAATGVFPTYPDAQYKVWADVLESCFQGWGTCRAWMQVFNNLKNGPDVLRLIQAYGIRTIDSGRFNLAPNYSGGLVGTLTDELSKGEIADLVKALNKKGIDFKIQ